MPPEADRGGDLAGLRVLVTRPAEHAGPLAAALAARGAEPIRLPAIEIVAPADPAPARAAAAGLARFDAVVFVSRSAVARLVTLGAAPPARGVPAILAVGEGTAGALEAAGFADVLRPGAGYGAAGVLALDALAPGRVAGRRVLLVKGEGGRPELAEALRARGAEVSAVDAYRRAPPEAAAGERLRALRGRLDVVTATSGEALENLLAIGAADWLRTLPWAVASERIAAIGAARGLARVEVAGEASDAALVDAVARAAGQARA